MKKEKNIKSNEIVMTVPRIDKIAIVIDIPDLAFATVISQNVWDELKDIDSGWVQPYFKGAYNTAAKIFCPDENGEINMQKPHMLLQIKTKGNFKPHMRIEYNPYKIPEKLYEHLDWVFQGITGQSFWETLSHGRVTRLDVCTDIPYLNPEDFMIKAKYARHSQCVFGFDGTLETIYFGKSKGTQYTVYKKALQEHGDDEGLPIMRVECRVRKSFPIQKLAFIDNPFERLEFFNLQPLKHPNVHPGHWKAFADSVRFRGSTNTALKLQPKDVRSKLKYCLSQNKFEGRKPSNLWGVHWLNTLEGCHLLDLPKAMSFSLQNAVGEGA